MELIGLAGAGLAFVMAWAAIVGTQAYRRNARIRRRLRPMAGVLATEATEQLAPQREREHKTTGGGALVARLDARYPLSGGVRSTVMAVAAGLLTFAGLVPTTSFFGVPVVLAFVIAIVAGVGLGWNVGKVLEDAKRSEFSDRFLIALDDFHRMVRYGMASNRALNSITAAAAEPVKTSLRNIVLDVEFGVPVGTAMEREALRVRISELAMLAAVVSTQSTTGGNLSESVGNLAATLRERLDNRSRMKAATAESRITMIILAFVPAAGIGLQAMMQPELVDLLMGEARGMLGIGIALIVAGLLIAWQMIRSAQR